MTQQTDRELLKEIHRAWVMASDTGGVIHHLSGPMSRVAAALARSEPEGVTDEGLLKMAAKELGYEFSPKWFLTGKNCPSLETDPYELLGFARAVTAADRAHYARPTIKPVPVADRPILKSSDFNDANGRCWCGTRASVDETGDLPVEMPPSWELREPCAQDDCVLSHHALPVPGAEVE